MNTAPFASLAGTLEFPDDFDDFARVMLETGAATRHGVVAKQVLLVALGDEHEVGAPAVQAGGDRRLGEKGVGGDGAARDVGDEVHGRDEGADPVGGLNGPKHISPPLTTTAAYGRSEARTIGNNAQGSKGQCDRQNRLKKLCPRHSWDLRKISINLQTRRGRKNQCLRNAHGGGNRP